MPQVDCRIVPIFASALALVFLISILFIQHNHDHHNAGPAHRTEEAQAMLDYNYDTSMSDEENPSTVSEYEIWKTSTPNGGFHISDNCLHCISEVIVGDKPSKLSNDEHFRISKAYWVDAGKPTLDYSVAPDSDIGSHKAYLLCVNDHLCAARTVKTFMERYEKDCNVDGVIDCYDHAATHVRGYNWCHEGVAPAELERFNRCFKKLVIK